VSTPARTNALASAGRHHPDPVTFRPRGLSPPRRFAPRLRSQVCCTLQPVVRFKAFWASACGASSNRPDPPDPARTLRSLSLRQPHRVTAAVAPLPLHPLRTPTANCQPVKPWTNRGARARRPPHPQCTAERTDDRHEGDRIRLLRQTPRPRSTRRHAAPDEQPPSQTREGQRVQPSLEGCSTSERCSAGETHHPATSAR
jgi:hypothetical protein